MKNKGFVYTILVLVSFFGHSQNNKLWKGYFSYNAIKDISQSSTQVYAAAENAYFKRDITTNEIATVSTIEGLSGQNISQIYHSETYKKTIIGHNDGLLIVVNDTDGTMLNVVDILNKPSVPPNKKKINHFMERNGKVYISTDFGISVYDLNLLEFGDTFFIGPGGSNIEILQTTVYNGFIYAVANGYGLIKALATNPNLIDFNQWSMVSATNWLSVEATETGLTGVTLAGALYNIVSDIPVLVTTYPQIPLDTRHNNGYLVITSQNHVYVYNSSLTEIVHVTSISNFPQATFTCATIINDKLYIGTRENGVMVTSLSNPTVFENTTPNGPDRNKIFAVQSFSNGFWAVYGDYSVSYNPYPLDSFGVSRYDSTNNWITTPYQDLFGAKSITRIVINPKNENQVFFSSNYSGLLKFENNIPIAPIFNATNSSLQTIPGQVPDDVRINGSAFDNDGNLWMTNSLVSKGLHVLKTDGQWQGYSPTTITTPGSVSFGRLAIDKNGTKWACTNFEGLIGFNEKFSNRSINIKEGQNEGNLPSNDVRAVAVDNKNKLWIGTVAGLRILQNVDSFLNQNELTTNSIIILEDDLAQELLYQQFITDIVVDGANNKWIGTADAGVFYISSDGQKTFSIFTKSNSPLPSNIITDIDINTKTGEVLIATESGMVSFKGTATSGAENFENVVVFPNPVRPEFNGNVAVSGLMNKSNVKITDIEGNLVHEGTSEGGTMLWDTKAFGKYKVASGVYMIFLSSDDGAETKVKKVMIVR
ncbi:two-component regulator propeller domain-containing protein [Flavobacterium sp.]|uniref:type IX secretion system anionic LPS delivery protein PorZ n=1 Tax=Flavobacterium sp. TaxID=239 RepID=UPI00374D5D73